MSMHDYLCAITPSEQRLSPHLTALRHATVQAIASHGMMSTPEQARFLSVLVQSLQARRVIEVGVFTGYSTLAMAAAMPETGQLVGCEIDQQAVAVGEPFWQAAGVAHKINVRLAPAVETLSLLLGRSSPGSDEVTQTQPNWRGCTDLIYIDADKRRYEAYYELALDLLRPGGLVVIDNVLLLQQGAVDQLDTPAAHAICAFNTKLVEDRRVTLAVVPLGSGMTVASKL